MKPYANNLEHILEELSRIDLLVRIHLENLREYFPEAGAEFRGLYVSEMEIEQIQKGPVFGSGQETFPDIRIERIKEIDEKRRDIDLKIEESLKIGRELRLHQLSKFFGLDPYEIDILLMGLAPELELKYEKLYSYLQNDVTKKKPTVDLALSLLFPAIEDKIKSRNYLSPAAPLRKYNLVYLFQGESNLGSPFVSSLIKIDERIIGFLLGFDELDLRIRDFCCLVIPRRTLDDLILPEDLKNKLINLASRYSRKKLPLKLIFCGSYGSGKKSAAEAFCREIGKNLLIVDSRNLLEGRSTDIADLIVREALLQDSALYLENCDLLFEDKIANNFPEFLLRTIKVFPGVIFLAGKESIEFVKILINIGFVPFSFPLPSYSVRKQLWKSCLIDYNLEEEIDLNALASKFRFSGGQITDAAHTAFSLAGEKNPDYPVLSMEDLYNGCKIQSNQKLGSFALKTNTRYSWEDLILPKDTLEHLKEVSSFIKFKGKVHFDWGFEKKLSLGKGLNVLFSGPPGTGKTMAAEVLANEAKLDLYKIDLSIVVSKYIGETEKNLKTIFEEAATSNCILFFDEADALFGKRSEVKDAHDRYANIETGYLLQKVEEYDGIVILATNLSKNIDSAFLRRTRYVIEFPFPDKEQRKRIWKGIFPYEAPLAKDVDYEYVSEKLNLSGGNIKNIALTAAFYAAEDSCEIGMSQIIRAARREYIKMGKPFLKEDFELYYEMIEAVEK